MKKHNVLLVCGSGASSGFMAANIRKAAAAAACPSLSMHAASPVLRIMSMRSTA